MKTTYILKTVNEKYMSDIYTVNGLDFETLYEADAKKFNSKEEAEQFIKDSNFDPSFIWPIPYESNKALVLVSNHGNHPDLTANGLLILNILILMMLELN